MENLSSASKSNDVIRLSKDPIKLAIWLLVAGAMLWLVAHIITTVLIFSLAALIAYLMTPCVKRISNEPLPFSKRNVPWWAATLIIYVFLIAIIVLLAVVLTPLIIEQSYSLSSSLPVSLQRLEGHFGMIQNWYTRFENELPPNLKASLAKYGQFLLQKLEPILSGFAAFVATSVLKILSIILILAAALILSLYIVLDEKNIKRHLIEMFPAAWKKDTEDLFHNMSQVVGVFIRGQIFMAVIVGVGSYLALLIVNLCGVKYEYSLITGIANGILFPIPYIGFWLPRLIPPIIAYAQSGGWTAFWVFVALLGWGTIADNVILPVVMGKGIGISPLMILVVVFAGGELFGIWGLILSIPAAAMIRLLFLYIQKHVTI